MDSEARQEPTKIPVCSLQFIWSMDGMLVVTRTVLGAAAVHKTIPFRVPRSVLRCWREFAGWVEIFVIAQMDVKRKRKKTHDSATTLLTVYHAAPSGQEWTKCNKKERKESSALRCWWHVCPVQAEEEQRANRTFRILFSSLPLPSHAPCCTSFVCVIFSAGMFLLHSIFRAGCTCMCVCLCVDVVIHYRLGKAFSAFECVSFCGLFCSPLPSFPFLVSCWE